MLKPVLVFLQKPSSELTLQDIQRFELALSSGTLRTEGGQSYAATTIVDLKKAIRIYLRWKLGKAKTEELTGWLDTRPVRKTPDYLKESEIDALYRNCKSSKERFLIAVLFDSGARASEFLNIRMEDVELPEERRPYVKLTLKEEYSKTLGRTIALYWKRSTEAVADYLQERERGGAGPNDPVYESSYDSARFLIQRLAKKALGKSAHLHLFRHSSATYYASRLNRQELCYRYGWKFSSDMPDVYISRAGMTSGNLDEKFMQTEIGTFQKELDQQREANRLIRDSQDRLSRENGVLRQELAKIRDVMNELLGLAARTKNGLFQTRNGARSSRNK